MNDATEQQRNAAGEVLNVLLNELQSVKEVLSQWVSYDLYRSSVNEVEDIFHEGRGARLSLHVWELSQRVNQQQRLIRKMRAIRIKTHTRETSV